MALAKAVVTGSVFRAPEKRFTQNNVPVSSFVLNIGEREEMLLDLCSWKFLKKHKLYRIKKQS